MNTWSELGGKKNLKNADTLHESVYAPPDKQKDHLTLLLNAAHSFKVESCRHYTRQLVNTARDLKQNDNYTSNKRALTDSNSSQTLVLNFLHAPTHHSESSQLQARKLVFRPW